MRLSRLAIKGKIWLMKRSLILEAVGKVGKKVRLCGWVNTRRDHGKVVFIDLRDRSGMIQLVIKDEVKLRPEDVIEVMGVVKERSERTINPDIPTGKVEIQVEEVKILASAADLPFDTGTKELKVSLPVLLDHRPLSLRHPKIKAIFKVQEVVIDTFRETLKNFDFTEFQAPMIIPSTTEGGSEVFKVQYYDHSVYLAQSPQFYKQIMTGVFERVFTVARVFRAEPSITTRHLSEYISLDAEMGFIDSWEEIMDCVEHVVREILKSIDKDCQAELALHDAVIPKLGKKFPHLKMREAQEIIYKKTGRDNRKEPDLEPQDEVDICQWALEEKGSEFVFISHFPTKKRPFYAFPDPKDPGYNCDFDLLGRGLEWVTGGQRINNYEQLVNSIKKRGNDPKEFGFYPDVFKYGMPPEGGFAIGAERLTMKVLGLTNVREASLFPRDMNRVDVRLATLGPAKTGKKK